MEFSTVLLTLLALIVGSYLLDSAIFFSRDPLEPDHVRSRVPLIGHLLGIRRFGAGRYYDHVALDRSKQKSGIFTLPIFNFKLYVISQRSFIGAVQRHAKTLSFTPFSAKTSRKFSGLGDIALRINDHLQGPPEAREYDRAQRAALSAGPDLDAMSLVAAKVMSSLVNGLVGKASEDEGSHIELYEWLRHLVAVSASEGMFGPMNPFRDPEHEADFWTFAEQAHLLVLGGLASRLFARDAINARERNGRRYEEYIRRGGHKEASGIVKERCRILKEAGATLRDLGRLNIGFDIAMLANYAPTTFWAVYEIFSRPELVDAIRDEVRKAVITSDAAADFMLDISVLKTACPLLLSSIQEAQRVNSVHANIREVLRDTSLTIDGRQILLKKGNYLQLNGVSMLRSEETWGPDAVEFDPYRFIKMKKTPGTPGVAAASEMLPHAFSVWGVAPHVCPARWFATSGIMMLVAMLVLRLDVEVEGDLKGRKPKAANDFSALPSPGEPVPVLVRPRKEFEGGWDVRVGESGARLQLSVA
ncbi:cytochrome p450 [Colletotrichum karsti]|uniref:Cytochrome p450 n=1 Tax=Colletotrichum karsti TaxID=1095194 RepID=A0A9P6I6P5_9PEZI|nr:cytochrome p450 [Colletotrichum karsti]KAF9874986.1 cytochrome p450 [Colletotrichum karsti]